MSRRAALLAALLAAAGCKNVSRCKTGTILVAVKLPAAIADADQLVIAVSVDAGPAKSTPLPHAAVASGSVEIDFASYPAGHPVDVTVTAMRQSLAVGAGSTSLTLPSGCGNAQVTLTAIAPDDGGGEIDGAGVEAGAPNACADGVQGVGESDIDCGGPCPPCANGKGCTVAGDCQSHVCNQVTKKCAASDCQDGLRDDQETDIDCGGATCPGCATGQSCKVANDCANKVCNTAKMLCVASTCDDGVLDGTETDVDCGGGCATKCKQGQSCLSTADCASPAACDATHHCVAAQCTNMMKDAANPTATPPVAAETDIDCGGTVCAPCALGKMCVGGSDCVSGFCNAMTKVCVADQCHDGLKDGSESDVDCGGSCAAKCTNGKMCSGSSDCGDANAICDGAHQCCSPSCSGKVCGSDGCGGSCGTCTSTTYPMCNTGGTACVCTNTSCPSPLACNGTSCYCPQGTTESCFDGVDNNCDGLVDCADPQCNGVGVCVPTAPGGFSYGYLTTHGSCPGTATALYSGVSSPTACTGCGSCTAYGRCTFTVYSNVVLADACPGGSPGTSTTLVGTTYADTQNPNGATCIMNTTFANESTTVAAWSGSCTPNGSPMKPSLNYTYQDFCTTSQIGGGCSNGKVCVPAAYTCVEGSGSCTGSSTQTLYTSVDDTLRGCSACTGCTVQNQGSCVSGNAFVDIFVGAAGDCTGGGNSIPNSSCGTASCDVCMPNGNTYHSAKAVMFSGGNPFCGGSASSTVTGSASLTGAVSICCGR
jgi:hypothetical protein